MSAATVRRAFDLGTLQAVLGRPVSDEQAEVVTSALEPRVVVAGAGSGKTATMVARVVWLVAHGRVPPDGVLGLTFTTKAADELAGRVRTGLRRLAAHGHLPRELADLEPTVSTYHAYAARLVRDHALRLGREPGARLVTPATAWQLFYDPIDGFAYEPGYEYVLRVAERNVPNPPADGSSVAYRLVRIVSKVRSGS